MVHDPALDTVVNALHWNSDSVWPAEDAATVVEALRNDGFLPPLSVPTPLSTVMEALDDRNCYGSDTNAQAILDALAEAGFPAHAPVEPQVPSRLGATKAVREAMRTLGFLPCLADATKVADAALAGAQQ